MDRGRPAVRGLAAGDAATSRSTRSTGSAPTRWRPSSSVDGEFEPGLASFAHGTRALATRENNCYSGERPGNRGLFHTGCGGGPTGAGEFAIFSLDSGIQAVGEGNYGRLGDEQQRRYTDANAETQFSEPATGGTPDEQPGAMPEIMPSEAPPGAPSTGTAPNIDRCWTCRSMFMQAWGHYGTAWAVVHQQLGVRPHLGHDRLEVVPQVPDGQSRVAGEDIRLGDGSVDVRGDPRGHALHDHHRHPRGAGADVPDRPHAPARRDGRRPSSSTATPVTASSRGRPTAGSRCGCGRSGRAPHARRRHDGLANARRSRDRYGGPGRGPLRAAGKLGVRRDDLTLAQARVAAPVGEVDDRGRVPSR